MFDLGALLSGLSRGMGQYSDIQFAEELLRGREQRKFSQQQQLAQQAFDRRKELELLLQDRGLEADSISSDWEARNAALLERLSAPGVEREQRLTKKYGEAGEVGEPLSPMDEAKINRENATINRENATAEYYRRRPTVPAGDKPDEGPLTKSQLGSESLKRGEEYAVSRLQEKIVSAMREESIGSKVGQNRPGMFKFGDITEEEAEQGFDFDDIADSITEPQNNATKEASREFWFAQHPEWRAEFERDRLQGQLSFLTEMAGLTSSASGYAGAARALTDEARVVQPEELPPLDEFFLTK